MGHEIIQPEWTFEELQNAQRLHDRQRYSREEIDEMFGLYNRIFNTKKQPTGCGKCIVNVLESLRRKYDELNKG